MNGSQCDLIDGGCLEGLVEGLVEGLGRLKIAIAIAIAIVSLQPRAGLMLIRNKPRFAQACFPGEMIKTAGR